MYKQGVRSVFCTSHNGYEEDDTDKYNAQFHLLNMMAKATLPEMTLHTSCELLCAGDYIDEILYGLEIGVFLPLGNSKFVLTEMYPDVTPEEAKMIVVLMIEKGWKPIIAHIERYPKLFESEETIPNLIKLGAKVQVNIRNLCEGNYPTQIRARWLLGNNLIYCIGSDSHNMTTRPPMYKEGIEYIYKTCSEEYADGICYKNAETILE